MSKGPRTVPYDKSGNLRNNPSKGDEWRENKPFRATLEFDHMLYRKNSAPLLIWRDDSGATFPMFVSSLSDLLASSGPVVNSGRVEAVWTVVKSGSRYGLIFHAAAKPFQIDNDEDLR